PVMYAHPASNSPSTVRHGENVRADTLRRIARISWQVDKCDLTGYTWRVKIRNFVHKGLKRLYEENNPKGLPPASVDKLRKMFASMDAMEDGDELRSIPKWNAHPMTGDATGT